MAKPRPTQAAVKALLADPSRAVDFDLKFGSGAANAQLLAEMIALLDELVAHTTKRKRVLRDADGEVIGLEVEED